MIPLELAEIAAITGGSVEPEHASVTVTAEAFLDSRQAVAGGLFVAIAGEHVDGHEYAEQAVSAGAAAVLGSRPTGVPTVVVPDAQQALAKLAHEVLARLRTGGAPRVVALTGSQGKTSAKDMLEAVLGSAGATVATYGSFNNELGMPLTVLRANRGTEFLVLEMGARGIGHIAELCAIARPDVSIVLNVGTAHIGEFGSRENIARAKGELVEALDATGVAVLNADDELVSAMADRTQGSVRTFGTTTDASVRIDGLELDDLGRARFDLVEAGERTPVHLAVLGEHQAANAAAAAVAARSLGLPMSRIAGALATATLSQWRMEMHQRPDGLVVLNDAYNANPESVRAALETLAAIGRRSGRRTIAVLGDMLELGETSQAQHAAIGPLLDELGIVVNLTIGPLASAIEGGASTRHVESVAEAVEWLGKNVLGNDVVLVKASRGSRLERVADALLEEEGKR